MSALPRLSFHLEDQFGKLHDPSELVGRVVVVLGADRAGQSLAARWGPLLLQALDERGVVERVRGYAVADLRGVPPALRGIVRRFLPSERDLTVLLDWEGELAGRYDFASGRCNVIVADGGGAVVLQSAEREPDGLRVATVADAIARVAGVRGR